MLYALIGCASLALLEGLGLWFLFARLRAEQSAASTADARADQLALSMNETYTKLAETRAVLAALNAREMATDVKTVQTTPDLAAAVARANGLQ